MNKDTFNNIVKLTLVFSIIILLADEFIYNSAENRYIEEEFMEKQITPQKQIINKLDIIDLDFDESRSIPVDKTSTHESNINLTDDIKDDNGIGDDIIENDNEKIDSITSNYNDIISNQIIEKKLLEDEINLWSAPSINTKYINEDFINRIDRDLKFSFYSMLRSDIFDILYNDISIELYEEKSDVRWKMKNKAIHMFWVNWLWSEEFISVFIHEFAHFLDLYYFKKSFNDDISDIFYNISWDWTKVLKRWQKISDFVSGYSMTNKYEDFAETFTYFVLHNEDFLKKVEKSIILEKKYEFFIKYIFKENSFLNTNFWNNENIKDYYWDITKININLKNFLKYIKS